jgi:hypothetical protein
VGLSEIGSLLPMRSRLVDKGPEKITINDISVKVVRRSLGIQSLSHNKKLGLILLSL